jgi:hypothetical protein
MRQAANLRAFQSAVALPGITFNTSQTNSRPVRQLRLVQFDGRVWQPIGEVLDTAFIGPANN